MQLELLKSSRGLLIKAAFTVAFFMSFFSYSVENIFQNGVVDVKPPRIYSYVCVSANYAGISSHECAESQFDATFAACQSWANQKEPAATDDFWSYSDWNCRYDAPTFNWVAYKTDVDNGTTVEQVIWARLSLEANSDEPSCPPEEFPDYQYIIFDDLGEEIVGCALPSQINLVDSCDLASGNGQLNIDVTSAMGCFTQPDGSVCEYHAESVGDGDKQIYVMNLEGDCYSNAWPTLDDNGVIGELPIGDDTCVTNGGIQFCSADPINECPNGVCNEGCGYINDQFICTSEPPETPPECTENCDPDPPECTEDCDPIVIPCTGDCDDPYTGLTVAITEGLGELTEKQTYTTITATVNKSAFDSLFSTDSIAILKSQSTVLEGQIQSFIQTAKDELNTMLTITAPNSSGYQARSLAIFNSTFDLSLNRFSDFFVLLAGPVMLLCSIFALFIILGKD